MNYQLEKQVADRLKAFFEPFDFIDKVAIFGSRAKHNANPKSDIDLCIYSLEMSDAQFSKLKIALEELPILYKIDVVHFEKSNEALRANIEKDGKSFFVKTLNFDNFFKTKTSKTYQIETKEYLEIGKYPVVDQGQKFIVAYSDNEDKLYRIEEPVIIFGDHTRIIKYIDFDFIVGADGTKILLPFDKTINAKYAYYQLLFTKIESLGYSRHFKVLKEKTFYKPSLTKQREIAQTLDKAQELIALRKASIEKLDELSQSIFVDMFGDPVTNPKGWNIVPLSNYGYLARGKSSHRPRNAPELYDGEYPFIQTGDVSNGNNIYLSKYKQTYSELGIKQSRLFKKNIIAIAIAANIGNAKILNIDCYFPDSVVGFETEFPEFSVYLLSFYKNQLDAKATKTAQKNINLKILNELDVIDVPKDRQKKFSQTIEKIESQKSLYEAELTKLQESFDALMAQSFEG